MKRLLTGTVVLLLGLAFVGGTVWWWRERQLDAFAATTFGPTEARDVTVPAGSSPRTVASLLAHAGVVSDAGLFYRFLRRGELGPKLRAGEYEFQGRATPEQVAEKLISGQQKTYRVTLPEGLRLDEVLQVLARSELHLDENKLLALAGDAAWVRHQGVPADRLEGFLFPDTYVFTRPFTAETVLSRLVTRGLEEARKAQSEQAPGAELNLLRLVTLASIVEKETGAPEERSHIACVYHNRLRRGMKLQADPTVLYAMMLLRGHFVKNITAQDLVTPHPYNTYTEEGLPPGPIANPGAAALLATAAPMACSDLYFVSRNDGTSVFCPTLICHNAAVKKWQQDYWAGKRSPAAKP
ncbi:MAG: endolytic transglycosylase MltG [Myxococcaceae bacterium]